MHASHTGVLPRLFRRLPLFGGRVAIAVPASIAISLVAYVLRVAVDAELPSGFPYVTFFPAVVISAMLFGLWGGVTSAVLGFLMSRWFFVAPFGSLSLSGPAGWAMLLYSFVVIVDIIAIHSAQVAFGGLDAERRRSRDLAESRELLFHELQHRVGNNLQMIGSLLALQGRRVPEGSARDAVDEAARRVRIVGNIQRTLYNADGAQRSLSAMLSPLVNDIVESAHGRAVGVRFQAERDPLVPAEQAIPLALIVSEAVSNALEHGFGADGGGMILLRVTGEATPDGEMLKISVEDDGAGLPDGFELAKSDSLGLKIARSLAASLGGSFAIQPLSSGGSGAMSVLTMPMPETATQVAATDDAVVTASAASPLLAGSPAA